MNLAKLIKTDSGMTLVETMAAVLLFGIALSGLLQVCTSSMTMGKRSDFSYVAYNLAKNRLETLKSVSYGSLSTTNETDTRLDSAGVPDDEGPYKRNTTVATSYNGDANLTLVTVTVDYSVKGAFANKPVTLTSVIYQYA